MPSPFLSKSKYLTGLQCPKLLWYQYNAKAQLPEVSSHTQATFDEGHKVGELAKKLFPGSIDLDHIIKWDKAIKETQKVLNKGNPIFEAAFLSNNTFARPDVLKPVEKEKNSLRTFHWDIIEIKSSTKVKDVNYHDLALQKYCYEGAGISINRCFLMHINNKYVRQGEIEPEKLFAVENITEEVERYSIGLAERVQEMLNVIAMPECPDVKIGKHCNNPYPCVMQSLCWDFIPDNSVFSLYRLNKAKAFEFVDSGCLCMGDVPADFNLSEKQNVQCVCEQTGSPHINKKKIKEFLNTLHFPQYHLDFETFGSAIPPFDGVKPYQQVPFQFSLHIWRDIDTKPEHYSFLAEGQDDPRPKLLKKLCELLGERGSIVAYNQGFEIGRLKESVEVFPEFKDWFENNIKPRFIDLLVPFRSFYYYNPSQKGSASIKKVLPALCGKSYEGMEIADGGAASREFARVTYTDVNEADRQQVRNALEKYCALDTQAMIDIVKALTGMVSDK